MSRRPDGLTESLRIKVHPGLCEAWGNCHRWAPEIYPLDDDGTIDLHVLEVPPEHAVEAWMGAEACPAHVITVVAINAVNTINAVSTATAVSAATEEPSP